VYKQKQDFRKNNICTKEECERLLSFTNNSGPLFIVGTVGVSMFGNSTIGFLLLITHLLASITVGFIFRFWKSNLEYVSNINYSYTYSKDNFSLSNLGKIIGNSISNSINTILLIGGFVVLFSVIISILKTSQLINLFANCINPFFTLLNIPNKFCNGFFYGILELTNGLSIVSSIPEKQLSINIIISSFLLGLGGISILLQVWSTIAKTDLSIKPYILGKLLHACLSALYTFIFLNSFPFFNFNL
jgi:sporulation integral membrane protein YlbJ